MYVQGNDPRQGRLEANRILYLLVVHHLRVCWHYHRQSTTLLTYYPSQYQPTLRRFIVLCSCACLLACTHANLEKTRNLLQCQPQGLSFRLVGYSRRLNNQDNCSICLLKSKKYQHVMVAQFYQCSKGLVRNVERPCTRNSTVRIVISHYHRQHFGHCQILPDSAHSRVI